MSESTKASKFTGIPAITGSVDASAIYLTLPDSLQIWRPTIASYLSSIGSTLVGFPLDSIKTRMQIHYYKSPLDCFKQTLKLEGFFGLYRGLSAPILSIAFSKSLGVSLYSNFKPKVCEVQEKIINVISPNFYNNFDSFSALKIILLNFPTSFISGSITGTLVSLFACPFEFTKVYSQIVYLESAKLAKNIQKEQLSSGTISSANPHHLASTVRIPVPSSTFEVAKQIVAAEGLFGLYSGIRFHLIREFISSGLYFSIYETAKMSITNIFSNSDGKIKNTNIIIGPISIAAAGALSGVFSWITVFFIDTTKSLVQKDIVVNIIRTQNGLAKIHRYRKLEFPTKRMYRGLSVSIMRSICNSIVFFGTFEFLMKHIG